MVGEISGTIAHERSETPPPNTNVVAHAQAQNKPSGPTHSRPNSIREIVRSWRSCACYDATTVKEKGRTEELGVLPSLMLPPAYGGRTFAYLNFLETASFSFGGMGVATAALVTSRTQ